MKPAAVLIALAGLTPAGTSAETRCTGTAPDWTLSIDDAGAAQLDYLLATDMQIMHTAQAEGRDWPKAMTLVGDRDTAIVIRQADGTAIVLTQRGQTPILLSGTCND